MNPAPSVIIFSVLSGLGFGLLAWLGLGFPAVTGWVAATFFALGFALAVGGLISSTFHLGNPQRALLAFTQWRTSWLSREAWLSVSALTANGLYALGPVFWEARIAPLGWLAALLSLATVFSTAMIYTQMKTVPRWRHWTTPALFLTLSLGGGALLAAQGEAAAILLLIAGGLQLYAWHHGDSALARSGSDTGTATGLGPAATVRLFEPPHTGGNYLTHEMVYRIGRKHAARLRIISLLAMSLLPAAMIGLLYNSHLLAGLAVLVHLAGTFVQRWLFFAEAEHVVGLYYGLRASPDQSNPSTTSVKRATGNGSRS
ncbi:dimethyl sulfoxide reductase anchor subunit family protein [Roseobacter sp. HKCCA0434]|uniref:dimethyl sulfoxide reductase anchor subunit family protein n=1 Tax=Roseobacter sp. HKCCA0434 TaxID=3079297 RepID=UPI002905B3C7|nr:DmsC/YnfH family molybdoenzyme membrane anchor subunit [Roseobacter sp. HKCCA0434]